MNAKQQRHWIALSVACIASLAGLARAEPPAAQDSPSYDAALAQRLGADERGMKRYVLVILKTGPAVNLDKQATAKLFDGHMANINRLANEGKLVVAGPLQKNAQNYRGIFIFNTSSVEETAVLLKTDPAIAGGLLAY